jgi:hypothetical protein
MKDKIFNAGRVWRKKKKKNVEKRAGIYASVYFLPTRHERDAFSALTRFEAKQGALLYIFHSTWIYTSEFIRLTACLHQH